MSRQRPLTVSEVETLFRIIKDLKSRGVTIIYISHRLEELFEIADRVTVMRDGCFVDTKEIAEIDRKQLISMMAGRELNESYPEKKCEIGEEVLRVEHLTEMGTQIFPSVFIREKFWALRVWWAPGERS